MKQAILVRKDLKMGKGKTAAQAAHASVGAYKKANFFKKKLWDLGGQKKVVLKVKDEKELIDYFAKAKRAGLATSLVRDAGRTQVRAGELTSLGIGPDSDEKVDKVTGGLKLL